MADLLNYPVLLFGVTAVFLMVLVEAGFRAGRGLDAHNPLHEQVKDTRDGIILLLSLLLGFTLAIALPCYDERKHLVLEEANDIGTSALRAAASRASQRRNGPVACEVRKPGEPISRRPLTTPGWRLRAVSNCKTISGG